MSARRTKPVQRASYTPKEFGERHGVPNSTLYRWMSQGRVRFVIGPSGSRRIPASEDAKLAGPQP